MSHVHTRHSGSDNLDLFTQEFWDARYRSADRIWSGNPNPHLVAHVAELVPRTALDVGCGEGADTIWLASLGWHVTAIDVSTVALDRAAEQAAAAGRRVADRITWQHAHQEEDEHQRANGGRHKLKQPRRELLHAGG